MKLVDTNVLVYALGREHPLKAACHRVLAWATAHPGELTTDAGALQEVLHLYATHATRGEAEKGATAVEEFLTILPGPIPIGVSEVSEAASLVRSHRRPSTRDAIHAAVVRVQSLDAIISADRDFDEVPVLVRLGPEAPMS